jgi:nitroreductase
MPATDTLSLSVTESLHRRRSVRAFTGEPVDPAVLEAVFAAAQRAPSGGNLQPWQATLVTGAAWQTVQDAVAARIAMGREGYQAEYDIYPKGLTDPWDSRRFGVGSGAGAGAGATGCGAGGGASGVGIAAQPATTSISAPAAA